MQGVMQWIKSSAAQKLQNGSESDVHCAQLKEPRWFHALLQENKLSESKALGSSHQQRLQNEVSGPRLAGSCQAVLASNAHSGCWTPTYAYNTEARFAAWQIPTVCDLEPGLHRLTASLPCQAGVVAA